MEIPGVERFRVLLFLHGWQISTFLLSWCCIFAANYGALPSPPSLFSYAHSLFSGIGIQRYSLIHFFSSPSRAPGHRAVRCTGGERGEEGRHYVPPILRAGQMHEERERGCPLKVTSRGTTSHNHEYLRTLLIVVGVAKCEYSSVSADEREP